MIKAYILIALLLYTHILFPQQRKELDYDINYDESKVPSYQLPALLGSSNGKEIKTPEEWNEIRRPEILSLFSNLIYGKIPVPVDPIETEYILQKEDAGFLNGKGIRKDLIIKLRNRNGEVEMKVLVVVPGAANKPSPAFLMISFDDSGSEKLQLSEKKNGRFNNGWPIEQILERGYAFVSVYHQDLVKHNDVDFNNSIQALFYQENQSFPKAKE